MASNEVSPIVVEEVDVERETVGSNHLVRNQDDECNFVCGDEWTPDVPADEQPVLGTVFESVELAISMYQTYAEKAGFDIRLSTDKKNKRNETTHIYVLCSKEGVPPKRSFDSIHDKSGFREHRNSNFKITGCKACARFKRLPGSSSFMLYYLVLKHNHPGIHEADRNLSRKRRQVSYSNQIFIQRASASNIGPSIAHRLQSSLKGGYDQVGGTEVDYKNCNRDLNMIVGDADADMLLKMMKAKKSYAPNFSFSYRTENDELTSLFWADEVAKFNYMEFGDVISFDATFRTNKYGMVFVPFTGIDNHKSSVTLGAALLSDETADSYKWLLEAFLEAHEKQPSIVVTDQDSSMQKAIEAVFTNSKHRLCMWHIMSKLSSKVMLGSEIYASFKKRINKLVWNEYLEPEVFDTKWADLLTEFKLEDNKWLSEMFDIRSKWIPAYFKYVSMSGLMKTTSRSESTNSFFNTFSHFTNTYGKFMLCFNAAMDKQRNGQRLFDHATRTTNPKYRTPLPIEKNASDLYTRTVFREVQKDIFKAAWSCVQQSVVSHDGVEVFTIIHKDKQDQYKAEFEVVVNASDSSVDCSFQHYVRHGLLCRHIFKVFIYNGVKEIPSRYVSRRWRKDVLPVELHHISYTSSQMNNGVEKIKNEARESFEYCLDRLTDHEDKLSSFADVVHSMRSDIDNDLPKPSESNRKSELVKSLFGVSPPKKVDIRPPSGIRNKGCGTGKRLIGPGEKALKKSEKQKRKCRTCGKYTNEHDSRNCPEKIRSSK